MRKLPALMLATIFLSLIFFSLTQTVFAYHGRTITWERPQYTTPTLTWNPIRTPRIILTLTPTRPQPTPTHQPLPTTTPTPVKLEPTPTKTQPTTTPVSLDQKQTYIMQEINNYRKSKGLTEVTTDPYTCSFAQTRAQEIVNNFNHDGFTQRVNNKTLPYPSYSRITENIAMTSNYTNVVSMWANSPGHALNMQKDTPYVCVGISDNYYAYEGWKP